MGNTVICKSIECHEMDMDQQYVFIPISVKGNDKLIAKIQQWFGNQKYTLFYTNGIHEGENQTRQCINVRNSKQNTDRETD